MKLVIPKPIPKILISILCLIVVFGLAGFLYVYLTDRTTDPAPKSVSSTSEQALSLPKPTVPAANTPEDASVDDIISPVIAGSNSSITITTIPQSTCSIIVSYSGIASTDSGLTPKTANDYGSVTWAWTVGAGVPVGSWPIKVTCVYRGRSAVVDSSVQVTH